MLNMSDVIRFNSTLTVWHEAIINGLSTKCNSLLYALEAVAAILLDGSAHVQVSVSDGKYMTTHQLNKKNKQIDVFNKKFVYTYIEAGTSDSRTL